MAVNIGPRIGIDGEAEYRKQLNNIIQQAKTLDSEMRSVTSSFDKNTSAQEKNKKTGEVLQKQIAVQERRIDELRKGLAAAADKYGENATETLKWREALNDATTSLNRMQNGMSSAKKTSTTFGSVLKANLLSDVIMSGLRSLGNLLQDVAREFADFVKEGVSYASDLEEVQNVIDVTFGDNADVVNQYTKDAIQQYGLSELAAKKYAGSLGAMLKSSGIAGDELTKMSTSLVGLTGDMASFYNLDPEEAFSKLSSAIAGETEPLRSLGINMNVANLEAYALSKGIDKAWSSMTQAEQATLRYQYIMENAADAQGDFARTSDSFANQSKKLSHQLQSVGGEIGSAFIPYLKDAAKALNEVFSGKISVSEFTGRIISVMRSGADALRQNLPEIQAAAQEILTAIIQIISEGLPLLAELAVPLLMTLAQGILENLPTIVQAGIEVLTALIQGIAQSLPTLIPVATQAIIELVGVLTRPENITAMINAAIELMLALAEGLVQAIPQLVAQIPVIIDNLVSAIMDNLPAIIEAGIQIMIALTVGLIESLPELLSSAGDIMSSLWNAIKNIDWLELGKSIIMGIIKGLISLAESILTTIVNIFKKPIEWIKNLGSQAITWGKDLIQGFVNGIKSMVQKVVDAVKNIGQKIKNFLHFSRPDEGPLRDYENWMPDFVSGLAQGIRDNAYLLEDAVSDMAARARISMTATGAGSTTTNVGGVRISVYGAPGQDVNALADIVMRRMQSAVNRKEAVFA